MSFVPAGVLAVAAVGLLVVFMPKDAGTPGGIPDSAGTDGSTVPTNVSAGADVFVFDPDHGAYNWEASLSIDAVGTFYTGDSLGVNDLVANAVRANGSTESIWPGRIMYRGYDSSGPRYTDHHPCPPGGRRRLGLQRDL